MNVAYENEPYTIVQSGEVVETVPVLEGFTAREGNAGGSGNTLRVIVLFLMTCTVWAIVAVLDRMSQQSSNAVAYPNKSDDNAANDKF